MANTKTVSGSGLRQYGLQLRCTEDSTSIPNNTSTISWSLVLTSGNYSFGDFWIGWTVKLGDKTVSHADDNYKAISISSNSSLVIASGTDTVTHNNDGTKTINIYGYLSISSAYPGPGDMTCSGDWALTTIPRASSMTLPSSFTIGSSGSITIQMASNTFSHTITYSGYGLSGTVANLNGDCGPYAQDLFKQSRDRIQLIQRYCQRPYIYKTDCSYCYTRSCQYERVDKQ